MLAVVIAGFLRFWQLGDVPPGLYRDEAVNGLDALDVIEGNREGESPFYFRANNGREPLYIYLTALAVSALGRTPEAVRIGASAAGTLTTLFVYLLAKEWFGRRVGLLSAVLWALTVWPLHLSRIGLRPILLPLTLTTSLWLGTLAYRNHWGERSSRWLWLLSGVVYGITFYTYLAARFTPILIILILLYLVATKRHKGLWPGLAWFAAGALIVLAPLIVLAFQEPELIAGRLDQVSIFSPAVNEGSVLGTLAGNTFAALGMFLVKGDTIVRHNPAGRPVFDLFMVAPVLIGLVWSLWNWRRAVAVTLILWIAVMLGPTILAEDTPHFLRAAGVLPAVIIVPALGLSWLWSWPKMPGRLGPALVLALLAGSLALTIKEYFIDYGRDQETGFWFEAAARSLAEDVNQFWEADASVMDRRFPDGWPSVRFLTQSIDDIEQYDISADPPEEISAPKVVYSWPHEGLDMVASAVTSPGLLAVKVGDLAKGDKEVEPYPLYVRYTLADPGDWPIWASLDNAIQLRFADQEEIEEGIIQVDVYWSALEEIDEALTSFVHLTEGGSIIAQSDSIPGSGYWPSQWWKPGLILIDEHILEFEEENSNNNKNTRQIHIGIYDANTMKPLTVEDSNGNPIGTTWIMQ